MKIEIKVTCVQCGKIEWIDVSENIPDEWRYYGEINVNSCKTDKYMWRMKDNAKSIFETERIKNSCYDPSVKPKWVELWFCKECDEKDD